MKHLFKQPFFYTSFLSLLALGLIIGSYVFGWTTPSQAPPGGNITLPSGVSPGVITAYGGASAPSGWLLCNGSAVSRTTYAGLFAVISTTYGVGDGSTTFNVPNLQQRFPLGKAAAGTGSTLGGTGGAIDHTHTGPSHTHTGPSHTHTYNTVIAHTHTISGTAASAGAHTHSLSTSYCSVHSCTTASAYVYMASATQVCGTVTVPSAGDHTHTVSGTAASTGSASGTTAADGTGATGASGTEATGSNNPPYLVVNYIIKY